MSSASPSRRDVISSLAEEILHHYGRGRIIVGVDGVAGSGTSAFAADLVARLQKRGHAAFHARMQDFRTPPDRRVAEGTAPDRDGDTFDVSAFRRVLVEPFRLAGSTGFVAAFWDGERDQPVEPKWLTAPDDAILVVDGAFLQRPDIRDVVSYAVWLQGGEASDAPERADAVYDDTDPAHPRRIFSDSC
jgi:uridine kinase